MDDQTDAEKKSLSDFMKRPDRTYCEGRFLSLAAELVRMGHKPRVIAYAALNTALRQAWDESPTNYSHFVRGLENISKEIVAKIDEWADEEAAAKLAGAHPDGTA